MHTCEVPIQMTLLYDPVGLLECDAPREGDLEQGNKLVKARGQGLFMANEQTRERMISDDVVDEGRTKTLL